MQYHLRQLALSAALARMLQSRSGKRLYSATRGWAHRAGRDVIETVAALGILPLAGVLVTAVEREGRMQGTDLELVGELRTGTRLPLSVSGGIDSFDELSRLETLGVDAVVLGMALYTGTLDPRMLAAEFTT